MQMSAWLLSTYRTVRQVPLLQNPSTQEVKTKDPWTSWLVRLAEWQASELVMWMVTVRRCSVSTSGLCTHADVHSPTQVYLHTCVYLHVQAHMHIHIYHTHTSAPNNKKPKPTGYPCLHKSTHSTIIT